MRRGRGPVAALAVGIPARDEEALVEGCLTAVAAAAGAVEVPVTVVVAADRCTDGTASVAAAALRRLGLDGGVVATSAGRVGVARALAVDAALAATGVAPSQVWVASTDADTLVGPTWLATHLRWARAGVDAVTGLVDVAWGRAPDGLAARHMAVVRAGGTTVGHAHVHGANLGLSGAWWRAVGGCGPGATGEDHELWRRLRAAGARTLGVDDLDVTTSGRLRGRAPDGFAAHLRALVDEPAPPLGAA